MSKSEEIIKDWHDAKTMYRSRFKLGLKLMMMVEIILALFDKIDDLKEEISYPDHW